MSDRAGECRRPVSVPGVTGRAKLVLVLAAVSVFPDCGGSEAASSPTAVDTWSQLLAGQPVAVFATYGQYVDLVLCDADLPSLHDGIDVAACPDGASKVLAVEFGYVVRSSFDDPLIAGLQDYREHHVIISRGEDRQHGIKYVHLLYTPLVEGDFVPVGAHVGNVVDRNPTGYEHVHVEMVRRVDRGTGSDEVWGFAEDVDDGNPLVKLPGFADTAAPVIESVSGDAGVPVTFQFYAGGPGGIEQDADDLRGPVAIVATLHDTCGSGPLPACSRTNPAQVTPSLTVAPLRFELTVRPASGDMDTPVEVFSMDLSEGVYDVRADHLYHSGSKGSYSDRSLRFVLTHRTPHDYSQACVWAPAKTGTYELELTVWDAAGTQVTEPPRTVIVASII